MTNLRESDVAHMAGPRANFIDAVWKLYDLKGGCEDRFKDLLEDLAGHYPPCEELSRNRGYYALLTMAHTLACGVDLIGNHTSERGCFERLDGERRKQAKPRRMRLWRLRRRLLAVPARVLVRARTASITILGASQELAIELSGCLLRLTPT